MKRQPEDDGIEVDVIQYFTLFPEGASQKQACAMERVMRRVRFQALYAAMARQLAESLFRHGG